MQFWNNFQDEQKKSTLCRNAKKEFWNEQSAAFQFQFENRCNPICFTCAIHNKKCAPYKMCTVQCTQSISGIFHPCSLRRWENCTIFSTIEKLEFILHKKKHEKSGTSTISPWELKSGKFDSIFCATFPRFASQLCCHISKYESSCFEVVFV